MLNKRIIFTAVNKAEFLEEKIGGPNDNQVLVELCYSTISSGTERANITGEVNVSVTSNDTVARFPRVSGYSSSGIVIDVGKNVKDIEVGDKVALSWSSHSKYCLMDRDNVHKIPYDNVSMQEAAMCHIATFPLSAIRKCNLQIGESAIVMGLGVLGLIAVELLKAAGAYPVIAVDPVKEKRELALKIGADYAFDPFDADFVKNVRLITGGVNVAIEVTGNGGALNGVLDCMAKFGRVALLGCTRASDFTVDYYKKVHGPGISLIGAHTFARPSYESVANMWTHHDDCMAVLKLLAGKRISFKTIIEATKSPENAQEVYDRLINDKNFPITQFSWRDI